MTRSSARSPHGSTRLPGTGPSIGCERPVGVHRHGFQDAGVHKPAQDSVAYLGVLRQLADGALTAFECGQGFLTLGSQPLGDEAVRPVLGQL